MNLHSSRWKVADEDRLDAEYSTDTWRDTSLGLMRRSERYLHESTRVIRLPGSEPSDTGS
jgi:hypothetical protein